MMLKRKSACHLLIALAALASTAMAQTGSGAEESALRFSGFGTLGAASARDPRRAFIRDITQPKGASNRGASFDIDSRLGIQTNYRISDNFEVVAQVVRRYRYENDFRPELTWGFLKYTINDMMEVRAGRIGFDGYIRSVTRAVG